MKISSLSLCACVCVCVCVCVCARTRMCVCFLGPYPQHMEVPKLGVKAELQLLAYAIATATWEP